MPSVASNPRDTAILAFFAAQEATSPQGPLIQLELDIITASNAGLFEVTGRTLTPAEALVMTGLGYTCKQVGAGWTVSWLRAAR